MTAENFNRILLVRNDKLGDFMLSYPAFALLKSSMPETEIHALVPGYTEPMADLCPWIDRVLIDPGPGTGPAALYRLRESIRKGRYEAVITLFSTARIGLAAAGAYIPYRFAPATKIAQVFYNYRLTQRRSRSVKPEYEYNRDLVRYFLDTFEIEPAESVQPPYLELPQDEVRKRRSEFVRMYGLPADRPLVFIHPGSGGSSANPPPGQFVSLGRVLGEDGRFSLVITAGPGEESGAREVADVLKQSSVPVSVYISTEGLQEFTRHLACADLFISGSTGPLHIAGVLNLRTVGFYSRKRTSSHIRWQTPNESSRRLHFSPPEHAEENDMTAIDMEAVGREIIHRLL